MSAQPHTSGTETAPKARILLVDDSRFIRRLFTFVFQDLGYEIDTAQDGLEGLRMAGDRAYDVVVVDGTLPDLDGRQVCRHLRSLPGPGRIVILYTGSKRHYQERHIAMQDGVDLFLRKDADSQLLVDRVTELLAARDLVRCA